MPYKNKDTYNAYMKNYYANNKEKLKQQIVTRTKIYRKQIRDYLRDLKTAPCADCGLLYSWWIMQFDHARGKKIFSIAAGSNVSKEALSEELAKCDLVCANCHADRTYKRTL